MKITETLSVKITDIFIDNHVFPSRQRAAYIYCFDFYFDLFLYNLSLLILGIFFHHGWLALVYVFTMSPLKMLAGGMHASSRSICDIISYLTFCIGIIVTIYLPVPAIQTFPSFWCFCVLLIAIIILAPVDTKSHRLTQKKKRRLKCLTAIYSIILLSLYLIFFNFFRFDSIQIMFFCVIVIWINQLLGRISKGGSQ